MEEGDTLVLNDTKVLPARLIGVKEDTGAVIEVLLLKDAQGDVWECLTRPAKRVKVGTIISFVAPEANEFTSNDNVLSCFFVTV